MIFQPKGKKGVLGLPFKWLFGFLAGAFILMFFLRFAYVHIAQEGSLEERRSVVQLDDELDAFGISEASSKQLPWKYKEQLIFTCDTIATAGYSRKTDKIIYAPTRLQDDIIHAWTQQWRFPFSIVNFYYLSNPRTRVLLVPSPTTASYVEDLRVPQLFNVQTINNQRFDLQTLAQQLQGLTQLHVVFFGTPSISPGDILYRFRNSPTKIIVSVVNVGTHTITTHVGTREITSSYLGDEQLFGLFFAGEGYSCVQALAQKRMRTMTTIYLHKVERLIGKTPDEECKNLLYAARDTLETYQTLEGTAALYEYKETLRKQNLKLEQQACSTIY